MWIGLAIVAAFFFALRLAVVRSVMGWVFMALFGPIYALAVRTPKPGVWDTEVTSDEAIARDMRLNNGSPAPFAELRAELAAVGFTSARLLRTGRTDRLMYGLTLALVHEESATIALIAGLAAGPHISPTALTLHTYLTGGPVTTFSSDGPDSGLGTQPRTNCFPTLRTPAYLWPAHNAVLCNYANEAIAAMPVNASSTDQAWVAFLKNLTDDQRQRSVAAGLMRPDAPGKRMYTIRGALRSTKSVLWPWKQRDSSKLLLKEEEILTEMGVANLLAAARLYDSQRPVAPTLSLKEQAVLFPDDRGVPHPIKPAVNLQFDERAADPKFRALLDAASGSRRMPAGWPSLWMVLAVFGAAYTGYLIGLPNWALVLLVIAASLASSLVLTNRRGSVPPAESGRARLLAQALCPCCLYSLSGLIADGDGCITCPECGAAWRADRIIEPRAFTQQSADASFIFRRPRVNTGVASTDDRGRGCQLVPPKLKLERLIAGERSLPRLERVAEATKHAGRATRLTLALTWASMVFGIPLILLPDILQLKPLEILGVGGVFAVPALAPMFAILPSSLGRSGRPFINAMLAEGLCPSCANLLPDRPAEPDGCTTCSCGAAWKVPAAKPA